MLKPPWRFGAEAPQRIVPREAEAHGYSGAFPQRAFVEMAMADAEMKAVGFIKRTLPNGICPTGFAQREPPGRDGKICTTETIERDKIRPVEPSSVTGFVQQDLSSVAIFAHCA